MILGSIIEGEVTIYYMLFALVCLLVLGLILGKLAELVKIPAVTGYLLAGIICGPVIGLVNEHTSDTLSILSSIAIGFIAFSIGLELWLPKFKKSGKQIVLITVFQALLTTDVVFLLLLVFKQPIWLCLVLSAIACATAPAPIMMIVKRYQAKGQVTDTLVPVVGLDDGVGIIVFGVFLSISSSLLSGKDLDIHTALLEPLLEIVLSIFFGALLGIILEKLARHVFIKFGKHEKNDAYLTVSICAVLLSVTGSHYAGLSPILTPMVAGMVFTNFVNKESFKLQAKAVDKFTAPLMICFFTLAGADLDFSILLSAGIVGIIYVVARVIGKVSGAYIGAKISKAPKNVQKYLGLGLLPQGGVAIGMVIACTTVFPEQEGLFVQTVVLAGIVIYELVGPSLVKLGLKLAGELHSEDEKKKVHTNEPEEKIELSIEHSIFEIKNHEEENKIEQEQK